MQINQYDCVPIKLDLEKLTKDWFLVQALVILP
jgi:hypothetical protein